MPSAVAYTEFSHRLKRTAFFLAAMLIGSIAAQAQPQTQALNPKDLPLDHCVPVLAIDASLQGLEAENASALIGNLSRLNSLAGHSIQPGAGPEQAHESAQVPGDTALWNEVQQSSLAAFARNQRLRDLSLMRRIYEASVRLRMGESVPPANSPDYPPYQLLTQLRELLKNQDHRPARNPGECSVDLSFQIMEQNAERFLNDYMKQYPDAFKKSKTPSSSVSEQARKTQSTLSEMYVLYHYYMKDTSNLRYLNDVSQFMFDGLMADAAMGQDARDIGALAEKEKARYLTQPAFMRRLLDFWLTIDDMNPSWDASYRSSSLEALP